MIGHPPEKMVGWIYPIIRALLPTDQREQTTDRQLQERIVVESGLDWVLVRPPRLTNGHRTGVYRVGEGIELGSFARVSRADVADFMLKQVAGQGLTQIGVAIAY